MNPRPRILFYDDNPEFGGHQVMAALAMEGMVRDGGSEVHFWFSEANQRWPGRIAALLDSGLHTAPAPTRTRKLQVMRNLWERSPELKARLRELNPDLVVFIQGDIEHSSLALLEARRSGHPVLSYIPMAHPHAVMRAKLPGLRDLLAGRVFRAVPEWITISESCRLQLADRSPGSRIHVVENGIPVEQFPGPSTEAALQLRRQTGIPTEVSICAMIGRVEFNQKRQNLAVAALEAHPDCFQGWHLLLVGSGPDDDRLDALIQASPARARIHRLQWLEQPQGIYSAIDCLLLPSGYEGVPLVMLEALACGVPVIASNRDGMRDLLPAEWLFPQGDASALARQFRKASHDNFPGLAALRERVRRDNTVEVFQRAFQSVLMKRSA